MIITKILYLMGTTYCELNHLHLEKMCVGQNAEYVFYKNIHTNVSSLLA